MKKIKLFFIAFFVLGMVVINLCWVNVGNESNMALSKLLGYTQQALAQLSDDGDAAFAGKKLKQVSCTCPNGKSGTTLKCETDGDLEKCTKTQQGSNACYKVGISGLKLCGEGN